MRVLHCVQDDNICKDKDCEEVKHVDYDCGCFEFC
jgi:hypothetical protein